MADNADDSGKQAEAEPRAGQRLANARRANGISMRDIAKELHLDEVKVQALEDNRFDVLGAPVFTKGYLRKYAELVQVSIDDVLADYYRMNRATGAPPVVGRPRQKPASPINLGRWIVTVVLLALAGGAAYWWINLPHAGVAPGKAVDTPLRSEPLPVRDQPSPAADEPVAEPAVELAAPSAGTAETSAVKTPAAASTVAGGLRLELDFSGDCWTEVTDGSGRRLFFGLGTAGRKVSVSGAPPLRVLLGNNDNVSVRVNGESYAVSAAELRGNTARLSLGGS
jgi:cytoskeleton protein RodZ